MAPSARERSWSALPQQLAAAGRDRVRIDTRSLATFRIGAALLIVADILLRSRNFYRFYSPDGMHPAGPPPETIAPDALSVFAIADGPNVVALLFGGGLLAALALLVGYRSRVAVVLSFLFVMSLDHYNPFVVSYADTLFRLLLFWAIFLPLGERWSIDALQAQRPPRAAIANVASGAILLQIVVMYFVNGLHKVPSPRWRSGMAGVYVFGIDEITFVLGDMLRAVPTLLQFGALVWVHLLILSPLLLVMLGWRRLMLVFLLFGGHASFALTVRIGAFPYVAMTGLLLFIPPIAWSELDVLTDGLAQRSGRLRAIGLGLRRLGTPVAARLPAWRPDIGRPHLARRASTVVMIVLLSTVLLIPLPGLMAAPFEEVQAPVSPDHPVPNALAPIGVSQPPWTIFAGPGPRDIDQWYVFPARTTDGRLIDAFNGGSLNWTRPHDQLQRQHDTYRDRFFLTHLGRTPDASVATAYANYLCEQWSGDHEGELASLAMWRVTEQITPATIDHPEARERTHELLHRHSCVDESTPGPIGPPPGAATS